MKNLRQLKILDLVKSHEIETQEDLLSLLKKAGFDVTQATVSRDIKKLQLTKVSLPDGRYRYNVMNGNVVTVDEAAKYRNILSEVVKRVVQAGNLVVVNTLSGAAQAACAAIDAMGYKEIQGSIAGDDTIFLAFLEPDAAANFIAKLDFSKK